MFFGFCLIHILTFPTKIMEVSVFYKLQKDEIFIISLGAKFTYK